MNNSGKLVVGVLAGAAVGALIGMLLAPEKGSDTRDRLAQMGDDYAGDITDKIRELRDSINARIDALKTDGKNIVEDAINEDVKDLARTAVTGKHVGRSNQNSGFGSGTAL